jgi:hypothetical protein
LENVWGLRKMVFDQDERKMLENLIISKLVTLPEVSRAYHLKKLKGHPMAGLIEKKMLACQWESEILGRLLQKLS